MDRLLEEIVGRYAPHVENRLRSTFPLTSAAPDLYGMLQYHLGWMDATLRPTSHSGGKMLRSTLCLLACEAAGGDYHSALGAAAAVELVHNFTLIHDDIQDRSEERRHRKTVWTIWGEPLAINAGDAMFSMAQLTLLDPRDQATPPAISLEMARLLNRTCLRLTEGQHLDISFEGRLDVNLEEYAAMIAGKTAALLGCSLALGALLGSQQSLVADGYREVGEELGLAFQIQDDILGIWGDESRTGKPRASDLFQRKNTWPVIYGLQHASPSDQKTLRSIYAGPEVLPEQVEVIVSVLDELDARNRTMELAQRHLSMALDRLDGLRPEEPAATSLRALATFLISRDY